MTESPEKNKSSEVTPSDKKPEFFFIDRETVRSLAKAVDLPPAAVVDLTYSEKAQDTGKEILLEGENYHELQELVDKKAEEGKAIVLTDWRPLRHLIKDPRFYGLLANKRSAFLRLPFKIEDLRNLLKHLESLPNIKDNVAIQIAATGERHYQIGPLKHALEPHKLGQPRVAETVEKVNKLFGTTFDPTTEQEAARTYLEQIKEERGKMFENQTLSGVFCDIEGTLIDVETGEVNTELLEKLDEYDKETFVRLWTGGNVAELREKLLDKIKKPWMVLSKYDFSGSKPEIVIDDLEQDSFRKEYNINPEKFMHPRELQQPKNS